MENKKKYWIGPLPIYCDICGRNVKQEFVDGKTKHGPWANMCINCFNTHGIRLGTGLGQHYKLDETGRYAKVEG